MGQHDHAGEQRQMHGDHRQRYGRGDGAFDDYG